MNDRTDGTDPTDRDWRNVMNLTKQEIILAVLAAAVWVFVLFGANLID